MAMTPKTRRARTGAVVVLSAAVLLLSACSGGDAKPGAAGGKGDAATTSAPPAMAIDVRPDANIEMSPTTPIEVQATGGKLTKVTVTNTKKGSTVTGAFAAGNASWQSNEPLAYGATYNIVADGTDSTGKPNEKTSTVSTVNPKSTIFPSLVPPPSISDVGVGQPVVVQFDKPVPDKATMEKDLQVTSTPSQPGSWYWISNKEVHYRPRNYWKPGTQIKVHIGIYGKDLGGGVYGDTDRDVNLKVHDSWIAKADGNSEQMKIYENGNLVKTMPISMGKDATPTHLGAHVISFKQRNYTMDSCTYGVCKGSPGYYRSVEHYVERISNDGEFVHENPNSVGDQGSSNVSHGCINLNAANASWFYSHFGLGDVVEVTNSGGKQLPIFDTYGDWALSWAEWQKSSAL